ncbi:MAG: DUF4124 domain-containing protein [Burkholderiales bacterium]|nr:DUF4124 domain-containing protein [Burkholderiales bacterium]
MSGPLRIACIGLLAAVVVSGAWGQAAIYTCVDGHGRRITSDRPITACADREQKELNPSGTVRRVIGPTLTPNELAAQERQQRLAAEARQREQERRRVDKLLLARYPDQAAHDRARAQALQHAQGSEKQRIAARFDAELARLKLLWAQGSATEAAASAQPLAR